MSDILQRAIEEAALQMNDDELRSYQKELGECEILVKNLESDKAALTRELEAALTASQAREARLREALGWLHEMAGYASQHVDPDWAKNNGLDLSDAISKAQAALSDTGQG